MRLLTPIFLLASFSLSAQSLYYGWPGLGEASCSEWLNCATGCSACNSPIATGAALIGTSATWIDMNPCPHPKGDGDSVVETHGWTSTPGDAMVVLGMIALQPMQVDSIIIDHQGMEGGNEHLQVRYGINIALPTEVIKDESISLGEQRTIITDVGCITPGEGGAFGTAQLILQAYGPGDGWWLDNVRIVASPCFTTGIVTVTPTSVIDRRPVMDLFGRRIDDSAAQGVYLNAQHQRVVVLP
ncbi:MAG: hypothetical protein ABI432_03545 [Flavobacteriales bacterium]